MAEGNPRLVFACTSEYGLLRSEDAGATWARLKAPRTALSVAVSPADARTLYGAFGKDGVWKSTDGGATWAPAGAGIEPGCIIREVALHPARPDCVYCIGWVYWKGLFYLGYRKPLVLRYDPDAGELWAGGVGLFKTKP